MPGRTTPSPAGRAPPARLFLSLLLTINLLNYMDRYVLSAVATRIRDEFFAPTDADANKKMGFLATAFLLSYMLTAPLFGWLGDRTRRWVIIGIGVLLWSAATLGSGLAATYGMLLTMRLLVGVGEGAYGPVAPTIIADLFPVSKRGSKLAWFYLAIPVGSALGFQLGGMVAAKFTWHTAFYVATAPGVLLGAWALFLRDPPRGLSDTLVARRPRLRDYRTLATTPSYVLNTLGMAAMTFAVGGLAFWMPAYVAEYRMNKPGDPEALRAANSVIGPVLAGTGLVATLAGGWLSDRLRDRFGGAYFLTSGVGMLLGFPAFVGMLYAPFPWAYVLMGVAMFFLFFNTGPTNTIIANVTHPSLRAAAFAANILLIHVLGDATSPPILGWIVDATKSPAHPMGNWNLAFLLIGVAMLLSGVLWLCGARFLKRDTELAPRRLA